MSDRRYMFRGCPCGDAFCAGCDDPTSDVARGMWEVLRLTPEHERDALSERRSESILARRRFSR